MSQTIDLLRRPEVASSPTRADRAAGPTDRREVATKETDFRDSLKQARGDSARRTEEEKPVERVAEGKPKGEPDAAEATPADESQSTQKDVKADASATPDEAATDIPAEDAPEVPAEISATADEASAEDKATPLSNVPPKAQKDADVELDSAPAPVEVTAEPAKPSDVPAQPLPADGSVDEVETEDKSSTDEPTPDTEAADPALPIATATKASEIDTSADVTADAETPEEPLAARRSTRPQPQMAATTEAKTDAPADSGVETAKNAAPGDSAANSRNLAAAPAPPATAAVESGKPARRAASADATGATQPVAVQGDKPKFDLGPIASRPMSAQAPLPQPAVEAVTMAVRGQLHSNGGAMTIRLDPPQLGSLKIQVAMSEGQLTATFTATNEVTARMLNQSLSQLRSGLEQMGMSVDRLQVQRGSNDASAGQTGHQSAGDGRGGDASQQQMHQQQREGQRRDLMLQMWQRTSYGLDALDLVA